MADNTSQSSTGTEDPEARSLRLYQEARSKASLSIPPSYDAMMKMDAEKSAARSDEKKISIWQKYYETLDDANRERLPVLSDQWAIEAIPHGTDGEDYIDYPGSEYDSQIHYTFRPELSNKLVIDEMGVARWESIYGPPLPSNLPPFLRLVVQAAGLPAPLSPRAPSVRASTRSTRGPGAPFHDTSSDA